MKKIVLSLIVSLFFAGSAIGQMPLPSAVPLPMVSLPSCTMTADPAVIQPGGTSVIRWEAPVGSSFSIDQEVGQVLTMGMRAVTQSHTVYYTGTATGPFGTVSCGVNVGVQALNLASDWYLQFEKGSIVNDESGWGSVDFPTSSLPVSIEPGLVYQDGSQTYQGKIPGLSGSWVNIWFAPNVRPGQEKYMEVSIGIPDTSFGVAVPGVHYITCKLFVDKESETYAWGVMTAEYREPQDAYGKSISVPSKLLSSTCKGWKQQKGGGGKG